MRFLQITTLILTFFGCSIIANAGTKVLMKTTEGNITIELENEKAPLTSQNFLTYVKEGFYNGTTFHRVIPNFMIQGGGFDKNMDVKKTHPAIVNEATNNLKNVRGSIAMARTSDINSATSQFFINVTDNEFLNHQSNSPQMYGYAVFGKVIEGMDVADKISNVKTTKRGPYSDVPEVAIVITSVEIK